MTGETVPPAGDAARVTVFVRVPQEDAFRIFVEDIDRWWRRGFQFRSGGRKPSRMAFEPGPSGRLVESVGLPGGGERQHEFGRIRIWEPPRRLAFSWRGVNFAPDEVTDVDVSFAAVRGGTEVRLVHGGWSALRDDHPVRHGRTGSAFSAQLGMWWGELLDSYRVAST